MIFPFIFIRTFIKKMNWIFYNHVNKKGYFSNHENIISYDITTISKIVHPSLSKDMKGPVQINVNCYSLMLLCLKINCINLRTK